MQIFRNPNFDFLRWRWHAIVLSTLIIVAGAIAIARQGLPLGVDFSGGTHVVVQFEGDVDVNQVRQALDAVAGEKQVQRYGDAGDRQWLIKLPQMEGVEEGASLEQGARQIVDALTKAELPPFDVISTEIVGPVIGADLQRKGIFAAFFALLGILGYIAMRFRFSFAVGGTVAALHDVFVTIAFITFFGYELSLNVVAAILTITGYSVNDTIVIFDRVRENLRTSRRDPLALVVNRSVNQTLARTLITSGTTGMVVLALYLYGGEVLRGFAFTMLVGIISGTYSTVFIAAAIAIVLSERKRRPAVGGAGAAETPARKGRRVRAS